MCIIIECEIYPHIFSPKILCVYGDLLKTLQITMLVLNSTYAIHVVGYNTISLKAYSMAMRDKKKKKSKKK